MEMWDCPFCSNWEENLSLYNIQVEIGNHFLNFRQKLNFLKIQCPLSILVCDCFNLKPSNKSKLNNFYCKRVTKHHNFKSSHLFQVLVHPLCEGLLLYGIPFIWGKRDQLKKKEGRWEGMKAKETLDWCERCPSIESQREPSFPNRSRLL